MTTRQLEHHEIKNKEHKFPIAVVCDSITSPENVGMIFRISEAMGVECIYLCGDTPSPTHKRVKKTSRSTEKNVAHYSVDDIASTIDKLNEEGYITFALEVTSTSTCLTGADFSTKGKIAIIMGNEQHGVSLEALEKVHASLEISMFGKNTSINVVNSLSIALYEITKQLQ